MALVVAAAGCDVGGLEPGGGGGDGGGALGGPGFGYPVGDLATAPAGGWALTQLLSHYLASWGGRHLAQDISPFGGGEGAIDQPVHSVGDGVVRYAGPNGSTYKNVVLIEHTLDDGSTVCSFYGHITAPIVATGDEVARGQPIAAVIDWAIAAPGGASSNSHLHYVLLSAELCAASAAANGQLICGYDDGGESGVQGPDDEPYSYTSVGDPCGTQNYPDAFISPSQFIEAHHFDR